MDLLASTQQEHSAKYLSPALILRPSFMAIYCHSRPPPRGRPATRSFISIDEFIWTDEWE